LGHPRGDNKPLQKRQSRRPIYACVDRLLWQTPCEFQFLPLDIRNPNSSDYIYDPVTQMGCKVDLKRVVFFPRQNQVVYWLRVTNVLPPDVIVSPKSLVVDERSVWTQGLYKVAVPGRDIPMISAGSFIDMFLIAKSENIPAMLRVKMSLKGARLVQSEVMLKTASTGMSTGETPIDARIQELYQEIENNEFEEIELPEPELVPEEIIIP